MLFSFDCENSFAAHSAFYFLEYWLKWLFKCKRLPTPVNYQLTDEVFANTRKPQPFCDITMKRYNSMRFSHLIKEIVFNA